MCSDDRKCCPEPDDLPDDGHGSSIHADVPHSARVWNYWIGGKDHFPVDQQAGDDYARIFPGIVPLARAGRDFIDRVVTYLTADGGVRQFLDIGTGLPTENNTHQVAQRAAPNSRVVYVDNDPLVLVLGRALAASSPEGAANYLDADLRHPEHVLTGARQFLDFLQPITLMLMGVMGYILDDDTANAIVDALLEELPPGSFLALYDGAATDQAFIDAQHGYDATGAVPYRLRSPDQIRGFFTGLDLIDPGVVPLPHWRPAPSPLPPDTVEAYGGVARKP
ncbi:SAM-dependent methyltransferase [Actinomadura luteofluorescens]|uniref:SAM-dependent methyltransferase n=1 Tax=Actinomadura luteofluorescens TaxID=46163 RepID=UPI0021645642|nr:SAM-dependent methyltransferase [Actinomadura glauciflava]MCR3738382.1 S-adenosyl methyltransferase [Actinomadura glauciflava]